MIKPCSPRQFAGLVRLAILSWAVAAGAAAAGEPSGGVGPASALPMLPHVARVLAARGPLRIVAFGSSSTEGIGASSPAATYPSRLEADLTSLLPSGERVTVINRGVGGDDADDMAKRLARDVISAHPDLVIWQTGSNDPLRDVPLARFAAETRAGVAAMRRSGIDVILMEPQYCRLLQDTKGAQRYRATLRSLAVELRVPLVRRFDLMRQWLASGLMTAAQMEAPDGLHMADRGYRELAVVVAREILRDADLVEKTSAGWTPTEAPRAWSGAHL